MSALSGASGILQHGFEEPIASPFVVVDVLGTSELEIVTASQVFRADGSLALDNGLAKGTFFDGLADWKAAFPAVADLDLGEMRLAQHLREFTHKRRIDAGRVRRSLRRGALARGGARRGDFRGAAGGGLVFLTFHAGSVLESSRGGSGGREIS